MGSRKCEVATSSAAFFVSLSSPLPPPPPPPPPLIVILDFPRLHPRWPPFSLFSSSSHRKVLDYDVAQMLLAAAALDGQQEM